MEWVKGVRQLHVANRVLEGIVFELDTRNIETAEEIQKRIKYVQSALEDANSYFIKVEK